MRPSAPLPPGLEYRFRADLEPPKWIIHCRCGHEWVPDPETREHDCVVCRTREDRRDNPSPYLAELEAKERLRHPGIFASKATGRVKELMEGGSM